MPESDILDRLASLSLSHEAETALGLQIDLDRNNRQSLVEQGLWWIQPLFRASLDRGVGLALLPDTPLEMAPIVLYKRGAACTVASSLHVALPMLVYRLRLVGLPEAWASFQRKWRSVADELRTLQSALGEGDGLDTICEVAERVDWIAADEEWHPDVDKRLDARCAILQALDSSEAHRRYRMWLDDIVQGRQPKSLSCEGFGPWTRQAEVAAFLAALQLGQESSIESAAWQLLRGPAGLDSCQAGSPTHIIEPLAMAARGTLREAADELSIRIPALPVEVQDHPTWAASMEMLRETDRYSGLPHVQAAAILDEAENPVDAYYALISASFWSHAHLGEGFRPAAQAARLVAERSGWQAIAKRLASIGIEP